MALIVQDSFTDTAGDDLETQHTPELGGPWISHGTGKFKITDANRIRPDDTFGFASCRVHPTATPGSADYYIKATLHRKTGVLQYPALALRLNTISDDGYLLQYEHDQSRWALYKRTTGANGAAIGTAAHTMSNDTSYSIRFYVAGSGTTVLKMYIDEVLAIDVSDSSSPITAINKPTLNSFLEFNITNTTGYHWDYYEVGDGDGAPAGPTAAQLAGVFAQEHQGGVVIGRVDA